MFCKDDQIDEDDEHNDGNDEHDEDDNVETSMTKHLVYKEVLKRFR